MKTLALFLLVGMSFAQTKSINIGSLQYQGTGPFVNPKGVTVQASDYQLNLDSSTTTVNPIAFSSVVMFIKGTQGDIGALTTGPGCGTPGITYPCGIFFFGGPGLFYPACATLNTRINVYRENCLSIALQLTSMSTSSSPAGKNFTIPLLNGETFCAYGITNIYLTAKPDQTGLSPIPVPNEPGFWTPVSVPIVLQAASGCD